MKRRSFLMNTTRTAAIATAAATLGPRLLAAEAAGGGKRIRHSVCKWCFKDISLDDLCIAGKEFGLESVELLEAKDQPVLEKHGMSCAIYTFPTGKTPQGTQVGTIQNAFNRLEHHDTLVGIYEKALNDVAKVGGKQLICFSGNRGGMDDQQGMENCAIGLKRLLPLAEKLGITLVMELLNSKVNHPDYMCDHTNWGVALCEKIGSENFRLLYDIYHMQIMEGDVISTIRANHRWISHYHTGGVPGRAEIDETQELNYPAIIRAIADTGYTGFIGQEFVPRRPDKIASLRQGVEICTV